MIMKLTISNDAEMMIPKCRPGRIQWRRQERLLSGYHVSGIILGVMIVMNVKIVIIVIIVKMKKRMMIEEKLIMRLYQVVS